MNTAATMKRPISRWSIKQRPAERLQRLGIEYLSDVELLAILVGSTTQYSAVDMAKHVLDKFNNNLNTLGKARFHELKDIEGVGIHTDVRLWQQWSLAGADRWPPLNFGPIWVPPSVSTTSCYLE